MLRGMTLEQKRYVFWLDENDAKAEDARRNGETAIPRDARANTANESCMKQR
jgi:hypothetical protein